jgi:hypothetical protein
MPTIPDTLRFFPVDAQIAHLHTVTQRTVALPVGSVIATVPSEFATMRVALHLTEEPYDPECDIHFSQITSLQSAIVVQYINGLYRVAPTSQP